MFKSVAYCKLSKEISLEEFFSIISHYCSVSGFEQQSDADEGKRIFVSHRGLPIAWIGESVNCWKELASGSHRIICIRSRILDVGSGCEYYVLLTEYKLDKVDRLFKDSGTRIVSFAVKHRVFPPSLFRNGGKGDLLQSTLFFYDQVKNLHEFLGADYTTIVDADYDMQVGALDNPPSVNAFDNRTLALFRNDTSRLCLPYEERRLPTPRDFEISPDCELPNWAKIVEL